ncbi:MAG: ABC transporter permease [Chloroflexi bacterium]|nr:ABC transporter permease [Chloroflexota bacterium]
MATSQATTTITYRSKQKLRPIGLIVEGIREIWSRRRLAGYLVQAELKKKGANKVLGNVWWVLDPLLQMLVYVVLITVIRATTKADYPLFIFAAILPWKWFQSSISDGNSAVISREKLIKQLHFPKIILPVSTSLGEIVSFAFGLIPLFALLLIFYSHRLSVLIVLIPIIAVVQYLFTIGLVIALSAVNVFYRDVGNVTRHALRLWFYLSPALFSVQDIEKLGAEHPMISRLLSLNPFVPLFESYRNVIYYGQPPVWSGLLVVTFLSFFLIGLAILFFKRVEPSFAKVL